MEEYPLHVFGYRTLAESVRGGNAIEGIVTTRARLAELVQGEDRRCNGQGREDRHVPRGPVSTTVGQSADSGKTRWMG